MFWNSCKKEFGNKSNSINMANSDFSFCGQMFTNEMPIFFLWKRLDLAVVLCLTLVLIRISAFFHIKRIWNVFLGLKESLKGTQKWSLYAMTRIWILKITCAITTKKLKKKKKDLHHNAQGQPLKLQPCMLTDSKWMTVFNSIVFNITMIPNSGNRSKFGIDILNKQDRKALASSNEREPVKIRARQLKFYPMKLYTDTKARWRKVSQQFSAILSTSSCTHMRQKQPNFTQSKFSFNKQSLILLTSLCRSV